MPIQMTLKAAPQGVPVKLWTDTAQSEALEQLKNVARLPLTHSHVVAMPDVHYGRGATVGSVIATRGAIIPAAVGVDIGCGMHAVRLDLEASQLPDIRPNIRVRFSTSRNKIPPASEVISPPSNRASTSREPNS